MRRVNCTLIFWYSVVAFLVAFGALLAQDREEDRDWFRDWLEMDVKYIITAEERAVFSSLTTDHERDAFIDQFWRRRDPDPATLVNEFKEEHYRRIAYANENFKSGVPGWTTDRGRIYIMFGPPHERKSHVGGPYLRQSYEGGGQTQVFPFEVWRYRHIEGVGSDVEIEFVDPTMTGEFRLALNPDEKDALLYVSGSGGATLAEQAGLLTRSERMLNRYLADPKEPTFRRRLSDAPFEHLLRLFEISRPREIRFKDLQQLVTSRISYEQIPAQLEFHYLHLGGDDLLVSVTVKIEDRYLTFLEDSGLHKATVDLYGTVSTISGKVAFEFDDTISTSLNDPKQLRHAQSLYQRKLNLKPGMYKLDLVIRDRNSGQLGTIQEGLSLPKIGHEKLSGSSLILARRIELVDDVERLKEPFVLGLYKIIPQIDRRFGPTGALRVYFEVYGFEFDSSSRESDLAFNYRVVDQQGKLVTQIDRPDLLVEFHDRLITFRELDLRGYQPGTYSLGVTVNDRISDQRYSQSIPFEVLDQ